MASASTVTGTYPGDPTNIFASFTVNVDTSNNMNIDGQFSYKGPQSNIAYTYALPAPSSTATTYISVQIDPNGNVTTYTSTVSAPALTGPNVYILYNSSVAAGAANDSVVLTNTEQDVI